MNFLQKLKQSFLLFMRDRYGADILSKHMLYLAIALYIISVITRLPFLSLISFIVYGIIIFRMFSKNRYKRALENNKYIELKSKVQNEFNQAKTRFKNRKEYKYVKCKKCKTRLRLPRKVGKVNVKCSKCGNKFDVRA